MVSKEARFGCGDGVGSDPDSERNGGVKFHIRSAIDVVIDSVEPECETLPEIDPLGAVERAVPSADGIVKDVPCPLVEFPMCDERLLCGESGREEHECQDESVTSTEEHDGVILKSEGVRLRNSEEVPIIMFGEREE